MLTANLLIYLLEKVVHGGEITYEQLRSLPRAEGPESVIEAVNGAFHHLQHFVSDEDIRTKDLEYDQNMRGIAEWELECLLITMEIESQRIF